VGTSFQAGSGLLGAQQPMKASTPDLLHILRNVCFQVLALTSWITFLDILFIDPVARGYWRT
jgi:hypothetical protein